MINIKIKSKVALFAVTFLSIFAFSKYNANAVTFSSQVRYAGPTRIETAVSISKGGWTTSDNVMLSYSEDFPDALTAAPLAYYKNAPILLTATDAVPQATMDEIIRLQAKNLYLLGGTGVISAEIESNLKNAGYNVQRIGGTDRFETALKVADIINEVNTSKSAVITTAYNYPDALAIDPYAAMNGVPVLYTDPVALTESSNNWLTTHGITKVIITGGTGAVSQAIETKLLNEGIQVQRISGIDRYETALNIVKQFQGSFLNSVALTNGENFPDALAGGVLAAKKKTPLLLVTRDVMTDAVADYIRIKDNIELMILGGTGVVQNDINAYFRKAVVYGHSGKYRDLTAYKTGSGKNVMFVVLEQHGYEDAWNKDGAELVKMGNYLIDHLCLYNLSNWTIYVIPSANPDGLADGWTNNGPGRCTVTTGVDMNRSFPVGFTPIYTARYYTGGTSLLAPESRNLYNFILNNRNQSSTNILLDIHGWLSSTYGNSEIGKYFDNQFNISHTFSYGGGYLIAWSNSIGIKSTLVELPTPYSSTNIQNSNFSGKIYNAVINIVNAYRA
ncbi:MAG: cell wall-binding repeat-containing protein [Clostridiaceae bacterium]